MGKHGGGDKGAQFLRSNLELLGFGNARDALIQTVKELFENALDAVISMSARKGPPASFEDEVAAAAMLRVRVQWNRETGFVDVVCADTGTGMRAHEIRQLCCGVFETTKSGRGARKGELSCGKYGLGLKAATMYSQSHVPDASLKIATTSDSHEILYIELRIDPESEEPAVVQHVDSFAVNEGHRQFSGTEMRISIPAPETEEDIEYAADILAVYFQSLRYTVSESVGVHFALEMGETCVELGWDRGEQPVDRFLSDFGASVDDLVYATRCSKTHNVNCMALLVSDAPDGVIHEHIDITVLRYANHVPLMNANDFFLCALAKGVSSCRGWKKIGHICRRNSSHLMSQLVASPTQQRRTPLLAPRSPARLIIAIDISSDVDPARDSNVKYSNLKKTLLDKCYLKDAHQCCSCVILQLHQRGKIMSPQQGRDEELLLEYAPLVANAVASILNRSRQITATSKERDSSHTACSKDAELLTVSLQGILGQKLPHTMSLD